MLVLMSFKFINFAEHVGAYAFVFFTRGHIHNTNIPG